MRRILFLTVLVVVALAVAGATALATGGGGKKFSTKLTGFQEVPAISTAASGSFDSKLDGDELSYELSYSGIEGGTAFAAHIHLGQRGVNGGVSAFLCGGGDKPACPTPGGTVEGTIDAADVIGPAAQGILAGQLNELVRAIRAGAAYVNVHSTTFPGGEIRGQLKSDRRKGRDDD